MALAVEAVFGIEELPPGRAESVPPLLQGAHPELVGALRATDAGLLVVLRRAWRPS